MESAFTPKIYQQLDFLIASFWFGIIIYIVYDTIRIFRRCVPHGIFWISVEDLLYWIGVSISFFLLQFHINDGVFRWYSIIGAMFGMLGWWLLGSKIYVNQTSRFIRFLMKWIYKGICFLLSPVFWLEEKTKTIVGKGTKKIWRGIRRIGKRLTGRIKMITITLCKRKNVSEKKERKRTHGKKSADSKKKRKPV